MDKILSLLESVRPAVGSTDFMSFTTDELELLAGVVTSYLVAPGLAEEHEKPRLYALREKLERAWVDASL